MLVPSKHLCVVFMLYSFLILPPSTFSSCWWQWWINHLEVSFMLLLHWKSSASCLKNNDLGLQYLPKMLATESDQLIALDFLRIDVIVLIQRSLSTSISGKMKKKTWPKNAIICHVVSLVQLQRMSWTRFNRMP